ncbi:MAG: response regulator [Candidatus Peribacteraceae bacterium]|jgi:DNA-binding response OmpR family regulator
MAPDTNTKKQILVVEDDKNMNDSLQRKFQGLGCETEGCFDGEQALIKMGEKTYDGIMMDLMMPIKDGFAVLAKKSTTKNPTTPVYVLTTLGEEKCELARELGAKMTFIKSQMTAAQVIEEVKKDMGL